MAQKQSLATLIRVITIARNIVCLVVAGVIGNRADALFLLSWDQMNKSITVNGLPWIITGITMLIVIIIVGIWLKGNEVLTLLANHIAIALLMSRALSQSSPKSSI